MPRPRKCRMVGFVPDNPCFHPQLHNKDEVVLSIEEGKTIRIDGGNYQLSAGKACCRRLNGNCKRKGCEECEENK